MLEQELTDLLSTHRHKLVAPNKAVCTGCGHKCKYDEFPAHQAAIVFDYLEKK
jgi:hypothetical protein